MPTSKFKRKLFVYAHHLNVPFRTLEIDKKRSLLAEGKEPPLDNNLTIHKDNLHALEALLPTCGTRFADAIFQQGDLG
jgi:adenine-specific DNA-methyltransferase